MCTIQRDFENWTGFFFRKNYSNCFPKYNVEYVCHILLQNECLTPTSDHPVCLGTIGKVWKQENVSSKASSSLDPQPQPNVRDWFLFLGQEQERSSGLLDSWSADATQPLASPGCLAPLCQPKMEKCGKTCATPRFSCTLSRMGCWCLVLTLALSPGCSPTLSLRKSRLDNVTSPFCLRHQEALVIRTGNAIIKQMFM